MMIDNGTIIIIVIIINKIETIVILILIIIRLKCCYILEPTKAAKQSSLSSDKDQRIAVLQAKVFI